mmetsp:Transcript_27996/g.82323  ORF Transcript_27996/g.82323 Transcript_27996/m.82323 type:complete len:320 (-) Transcript_27996:253-1212(-)
MLQIVVSGGRRSGAQRHAIQILRDGFISLVIVIVGHELARREGGTEGREAFGRYGREGFGRGEAQKGFDQGDADARGLFLRRQWCGVLLLGGHLRQVGGGGGWSGPGRRRSGSRNGRGTLALLLLLGGIGGVPLPVAFGLAPARPLQLDEHFLAPRLDCILQSGSLVGHTDLHRPRTSDVAQLPIDQFTHPAELIVVGIAQTQYGVRDVLELIGRRGLALDVSHESIGVLGRIAVPRRAAHHDEAVLGARGGRILPDVEAFLSLELIELGAHDRIEQSGAEGGIFGRQVLRDVLRVSGRRTVQDEEGGHVFIYWEEIRE